jgi:integrase
MRPEEYLGLKWADIDLINKRVTVKRALIWRKGGGWYFGEPKTTRSRRTIPLPDSIIRLVAEHRRRQMETRLKAGVNYQVNDLVFVTLKGSPLNPRNLTLRHFKPILKNAGLPNTLRLYDLRHTCATLLLGANEHPKVVSERLGHASVTLTLRYLLARPSFYATSCNRQVREDFVQLTPNHMLLLIINGTNAVGAFGRVLKSRVYVCEKKA